MTTHSGFRLPRIFRRRGPKASHNTKAVVTGAGSGIGRAFALALAARGGEVICADISGERAQETADLISRIGGTAHPYFCDVSVRDDLLALAAFATTTFGSTPTLVINNAGVGIGGAPIGSIRFEDWDWALGINLMGVVNGCEIFTPGLRAARSGGIINVASAAGFAAAPRMGAYNVGKAAVVSLSETMYAELRGTGVRVTVLCPTFVDTNVVRDGRISGGADKIASAIMAVNVMNANRVAEISLDAYDRGKLYVVPQFDAKAIWAAKRLTPVTYARVIGLLARLLPAAPDVPATGPPSTREHDTSTSSTNGA